MFFATHLSNGYADFDETCNVHIYIFIHTLYPAKLNNI